MQNHIEFQKRRDFSEKVNTTFTFVKENASNFLKSIFFIAGPPVLVASLLSSSFMKSLMGSLTSGAGNTEALQQLVFSVNFWAELALMFVFLVVSYVFIISTSYNFMILYAEKREESFDVNDVWARVRDTLGMYFSTTILFGILGILAYSLMLIPVVLLFAVSPGLVILGGIAYVVVLVYVFVSLALVFPVRAFEQKGFTESLSRSFYLVRGKWWSTFGLAFILSILVGIISYVFSIPSAILTGIAALHDTTNGDSTQSGVIPTIAYILNALAYLTQLILYFLPTIGLAFQYFNLVEMKEAKGLMGKINTLGEPQTPRSQDEQY